jgi:hypothetical protein
MERLKKIVRGKRKETATAQPKLERAMVAKVEKRMKRGNN